MLEYEAPHAAVVDLYASEWFEQDLLVLTDPGWFGHDALRLPFRNGMVVESNGEDDSDITGSFDTVVIDQSSFDPASVSAAIVRAARVLRSGGRIVVAFPPANRDIATDQAPPGTRAMAARLVSDPEAFAGLAWRGVGYLNGRLCAILALAGLSDGPPAPIATLFVTAHTSFRLGVDQSGYAYGETRRRLDRVEALLEQHNEDRRRSEQALLQHLEVVVKELNEERRRHRGRALVHTVLNRHKTGRALIRVLRPLWRLLRRLRHGGVALKRRLASARDRLMSAHP